MCFFKKKKSESDLILEDKTLITDNASVCDVLIKLVEDDDLKADIAKLQDSIKFSNPSCLKEVSKLDLAIYDKLGDMKIAIVKANRCQLFDTPRKILEDLELIVVERNSIKS